MWNNYDFGSNFAVLIPHLRTRNAWKLMETAYYATLLDRIFIHEQKDRKSTVPSKWWKEYDALKERLFSTHDDPDDVLLSQQMKMEEKIMDRLGWSYRTNPDHLFHYVPFGTCHWWNPMVSLYLARKVCPKKQWVIAKGPKHTTIVCLEEKLVFDILYWGLDQRLEEYTLKQRYSSNDSTLGGLQAVQQAGVMSLDDRCRFFDSIDYMISW
jgi:hypothetical protein